MPRWLKASRWYLHASPSSFATVEGKGERRDNNRAGEKRRKWKGEEKTEGWRGLSRFSRLAAREMWKNTKRDASMLNSLEEQGRSVSSFATWLRDPVSPSLCRDSALPRLVGDYELVSLLRVWQCSFSLLFCFYLCRCSFLSLFFDDGERTLEPNGSLGRSESSWRELGYG